MQPITMLVKSRVGIEPIAAVNKPCKKEQGTPTYCMYVCMYIFRPGGRRPQKSPTGAQDVLS
jgi:hypothetical protein